MMGFKDSLGIFDFLKFAPLLIAGKVTFMLLQRHKLVFI